MIQRLVDRRLLSLSTSRSGALAYRFAGPLHEALELLDRCLVAVLGGGAPVTAHSCATLIHPEILERIGYLQWLPSIPLWTTPHGLAPAAGAGDADWVLSPSSCYSTFSHLEGLDEVWSLRRFTTRGRCHRHEPPADEATRMSSFDMRELVLIGEPQKVVDEAEASFERATELIRTLGGDVSIALAADVFYGERADAARTIQLARGVKREARLPWTDGTLVAVGSRNLHHELFTEAFAIGPQEPRVAMRSTCVAFGLERLLLTLLAATPAADPDELLARIAAAAPTPGSTPH